MPDKARPFARRPVKTRASTWAHWYQQQEWRSRSRDQLAAFPLCAECERDGLVVVASVADHIEPHKGNRRKFRDGVLQSLCRACSLRKTGQGK